MSCKNKILLPCERDRGDLASEGEVEQAVRTSVEQLLNYTPSHPLRAAAVSTAFQESGTGTGVLLEVGVYSDLT